MWCNFLQNDFKCCMEHFIQELMNDNGTILYFIKRNVDLSIILLNCIQKDSYHVFLTLHINSDSVLSGRN
jgi:hypothetical protein